MEKNEKIVICDQCQKTWSDLKDNEALCMLNVQRGFLYPQNTCIKYGSSDRRINLHFCGFGCLQTYFLNKNV